MIDKCPYCGSYLNVTTGGANCPKCHRNFIYTVTIDGMGLQLLETTYGTIIQVMR